MLHLLNYQEIEVLVDKLGKTGTNSFVCIEISIIHTFSVQERCYRCKVGKFYPSLFKKIKYSLIYTIYKHKLQKFVKACGDTTCKLRTKAKIPKEHEHENSSLMIQSLRNSAFQTIVIPK